MDLAPLRDQCRRYLDNDRTGMVLSTVQVQDLLQEIARWQAEVDADRRAARRALAALCDHDLEGVRNHLRQIEGE